MWVLQTILMTMDHNNFTKQHYLASICNEDKAHFPCSRNSIFKNYLFIFQTSKFTFLFCMFLKFLAHATRPIDQTILNSPPMEHVKKVHVNSHSCLLGYDTMQSGMWAHRCRGTYRIHLCAHGVCPKHWNPPVTIQRVKTQTAASKNTQLHGLHIVCTEYHMTE